MDSITIKESIANWQAIREDSEQLLYYLGQGNTFMYELQTYSETSEHIHAYPGIYQDRLYFFLIPAVYDDEAYADDIALYTTVCPVMWLLQGSQDRITAVVARERIAAWENHYKTWVPKDVVSEYGIFMAFVIPVQDFESAVSQVTLALQAEAFATEGLEADLVITNEEGKLTVYDDFVKPVPPFGATAMAQENFYLLS